ncbi:MAG: class I SAM-dependent methyltransferase [Verrucomicrobiota bacterium]
MIPVVKSAALSAGEKSVLIERLTEYYSNLSGFYYQLANQVAGRYAPDIVPFHCDLVSRVESGMSLLELGCGSAHLCLFVEAAGGSYTGMDYSDTLLKNNRERFPRARFLTIGTELADQVDIVASLYTLEHIVDPRSYLESMWDFCKPGGLIAIICPDFVDGDGFPPSFFFGKTPRRFREKLFSFALADAFLHLLDLAWHAPVWKSRARAASPGAFWINLMPRILHGAEYSVDADAVHLPRLKDIVWWLEKRGAAILETSRSMKNVSDEVLRYNCYAVARKPL